MEIALEKSDTSNCCLRAQATPCSYSVVSVATAPSEMRFDFDRPPEVVTSLDTEIFEHGIGVVGRLNDTNTRIS